jgi:hypothetical protein
MSRLDELKKKIRYKIYEASLSLTGKTSAEIKDDLRKSSFLISSIAKGYRKKAIKSIEENKGLLLKIFISFFAAFLIFFPVQIQQITTSLVIVIAIILVILVLLIIFAHVSPGFDIIGNLLFALIISLILLILSSSLNCGGQACFWVISTKIGTLGAMISFLAVLIFFLVLAFMVKNFVIYCIVITVLTSVLMFILIPLLSPANYYSFCKRIPFIYGSPICRPREVWVDPLKTVKIPVSGGIGMKIETPSTLYAGNPYEFLFTLTNYYERDISFELTPSIVSYYGSKMEFVQPFNQKISSLKPKEFYQDAVYFNPEEAYVKEGTCPYTTKQLSTASGLPPDKIACSIEKNCENPKAGCVKLDIFECGCVDWSLATCSKNPLKAKVNVKHTGFFLGNATLYYSEEIAKPAYATELTQGPLRIIIEFIPNPYIASIHQYRDEVSMFVTFKNLGGDIEVKSFKVMPQNTVIHTIDKEKQVELIEEVGTEIIECRDISEILPQTLTIGAEVGGKLCTLKPPFVKTTLIDLEKNETIEINNVTFSFIENYCYKKAQKTDQTGYTFWSSNWDKIYETVAESGLCELLKKKDVNESKIIKSALTHVDVLIEFEYIRRVDFYSEEIVPYTRTEQCISLEKD